MTTSSSRTLGELFDSFEREAFRLETLEDYSNSGSTHAYRQFLGGEDRPEDYNAGWLAELRSHTTQGRRIYRVHVLSRPLTPYLRFELGWGYTRSMTAGEEFFILDTTDKPNPVADVGDFWLFDEDTPVVMHYDSSGTVTERETLPAERAGEFVNCRDIALLHADPFPDWWVKYGE